MENQKKIIEVDRVKSTYSEGSLFFLVFVTKFTIQKLYHILKPMLRDSNVRTTTGLMYVPICGLTVADDAFFTGSLQT